MLEAELGNAAGPVGRQPGWPLGRIRSERNLYIPVGFAGCEPRNERGRCQQQERGHAEVLPPERAVERSRIQTELPLDRDFRVGDLELGDHIDDLVMRALDWLFRTWLPTSGYVPADQPCFEAWIGRPFEHGDEHFEIRVQVSVERS